MLTFRTHHENKTCLSCSVYSFYVLIVTRQLLIDLLNIVALEMVRCCVEQDSFLLLALRQINIALLLSLQKI